MSFVCTTRISIGLMINAGTDKFDPMQEAHLQWTRDRSGLNWEVSVHCQVRANETCSEAKRQFRVINKDVLMNTQSPHNWWSPHKSAVFGSSSLLPLLVSGGTGMLIS